jgi:hypothetical protein
MRKALALPLLPLAALALAAPAPAAGLPKVLTQREPLFQVRPAVISYTGDGTGLVGGTDGTSVRRPGHLRWMVYDARQGIGHGLLWLDDCSPDCASGTFHSTPVTVHVFMPVHGMFERLTLTYAYRGKRYVDRRGIRRIAASWQYYIIGSLP